jgi:hypothetical protein
VSFAPDDASLPDVQAEWKDADGVESSDFDATGDEATPDAPAESAAEAGSIVDGGLDAPHEADAPSGADAPSETGSDAVDAGCPGTVPKDAVYCCGTVPCVAPNAGKCQSACTTCEQQCADAGQACCLSPNGAFNGCRPDALMCP